MEGVSISKKKKVDVRKVLVRSPPSTGQRSRGCTVPWTVDTRRIAREQKARAVPGESRDLLLEQKTVTAHALQNKRQHAPL
jgi:hypothetical protein